MSDKLTLCQVEDTLNNSNELFLTFRREMEEMSKKTKRLEKENGNLTRKHELVNSNIVQMAEDRTRSQKEIDALRKKNDNLEKLCRGMQMQGRTVSSASADAVKGPNGGFDDVNLREAGTESEYDEEYDDDEDDENSEEDGFEDLDDDEEGMVQMRSSQHPAVGEQTTSGAQQQQISGLMSQRPLPNFAGLERPDKHVLPRINGVKH